MARSVINDEYYEVSRKAYERKPIDATAIPTDLHKLVRPEYFDPEFFATSAYGRLVAEAQAYRWIIQTPVRNYYASIARRKMDVTPQIRLQGRFFEQTPIPAFGGFARAVHHAGQ